MNRHNFIKNLGLGTCALFAPVGLIETEYEKRIRLMMGEFDCSRWIAVDIIKKQDYIIRGIKKYIDNAKWERV